MEAFFYKFLAYIYILINICILINCDDQKENIQTSEATTSINEIENQNPNISCRKLTIDKNGKINSENITEDILYNNTIKSIQFKESFIIYDCWNEIENACKFNSTENETDYTDTEESPFTAISPENCIKRETQGDKDNICCFYREKFENVPNKTYYGCLEINKYEIQKFKWALTDNLFKRNNGYILQIECNDKINKINKSFILLFLIIFINL